jgi:hypothetical protein
MSFGFSISDVATLVQLTSRAYSNWKNACGCYSKITSHLRILNAILRRLNREAKTPGSLLQDKDNNTRDWAEILNSTRTTVTRLNNVVVKFKSLGQSRKRNWNRLRFAYKDLGEIHTELTLRISSLSVYLHTIGISAIGRIEREMQGLSEMKEAIDKLADATRAGRQEGSVMTEYANDDQAIWREFRRELISEGFSSDSIRKHKMHLKDYLRSLHAGGHLDEEAWPSPCGSVDELDM